MPSPRKADRAPRRPRSPPRPGGKPRVRHDRRRCPRIDRDRRARPAGRAQRVRRDADRRADRRRCGDSTRDADVRAVVLLGAGQELLRRRRPQLDAKMARYGAAENLADAQALAHDAAHAPPTFASRPIARVHGAAFGGGVGLVACCDIAIAAHDATFALSEAKLGLIPATIAPYVVEAIGARAGAALFPDGRAVHRRGSVSHRPRARHRAAARARRRASTRCSARCCSAGPAAQAECKALIRARRAPADRRRGDRRHRARASRACALRPRAKEGVAAFLGKRRAGVGAAKR